jgi:hypothetical protein
MAPGGGATIGKTVFTCVYFKNLLLKNHWTRKAEIYMKAFRIQSAHVTAAFDILANSTNGENLVVTNLHSSNFA